MMILFNLLMLMPLTRETRRMNMSLKTKKTLLSMLRMIALSKKQSKSFASVNYLAQLRNKTCIAQRDKIVDSLILLTA